ncbi:hypothetical protein [uncultured Psychroserpens sp.]|uniref:hypothetical protein n=1 Tax=uncultured Psychroserpens sp. TaxID=255436 RepID=UPI0026232D68|nr:hypothetical protein [uncultured Psychroserpens sp.]
MKTLSITLLLSLAFISINAQTPFVKDSLSISTSVGFHQKVDFEDYEVKFKKLVSDSRCPKDVMCVRAGEAKVLVSIYKKGDFVLDKEITIHASGYVMEENNLAFNGTDFKIYGMTLKPYPKGTNSIPEQDYILDVVFQPKRL